jgi:uncharacterized membrane protein (DUF106 family)
MLDLWQRLCLSALDPVLGRVLGVSWTATFLFVSIGTAAVLAVSRKWITRQDLLRRACRDRRQLKRLIREARAAGRPAEVKRLKATKTMIATRVFADEMKPLALAILPVAVLATWCYARLGFHPPREAEPVRVEFFAPVSGVGELAHLLPRDGLTADGVGWIRELKSDGATPPSAVAEWAVRGRAAAEPFALTVVFRGRTFEHELRVGGALHSPELAVFGGGEYAVRLTMRSASLTGPFLDRIREGTSRGWPGIPLWLVEYLAVVIPATSLIKRGLRIW